MRTLMVPVIKVRSEDGYEHIVGTDSHDSLCIKDGQIYYCNMQSMGSTRFKDGGYEFVGGKDKDWQMAMGDYIEFVPLEDYIQMMADEAERQYENEVRMQEFIKNSIEKFKKAKKIRTETPEARARREKYEKALRKLRQNLNKLDELENSNGFIQHF